MKRLFIGLMLFAALWAACVPQAQTENELPQPDSVYTPLEAKGFVLAYYPNFTVVELRNPFQGSDSLSMHFVITDSTTVLPPVWANTPRIVRNPKRIVATSTTQLAMISKLGLHRRLVGVSGADYVSDSAITQQIQAGTTIDVGYAPNFAYESLVGLQPDLMMVYGVDASAEADVARLRKLSIPVVYNAEYLEDNPIGKLEWLVFVAAFYGREAEARAYVDSVAARYHSIQAKVSMTDKPKVLTGLPWRGSWTVNGGQSYIATILTDAGGEYLWADEATRDNFAVSLEGVFERSTQAKVWINVGTAQSLADIVATDARLAELPPYKTGRVYNNNKRLSAKGGNDYWESGVLRPDQILQDLVLILHEQNVNADSLVYYKKLNP